MSLRRAIAVLPQGHWTGDPVGTITLAFADRHKRRIRMIDDGGEAFLLDLPDAVLLGDGDGLELDGGGVIEVRAAEESVVDIACTDAAHAARIAWHIGNRHTAVQVLDGGRLRMADDLVMVHMVEGLGGAVSRTTAPFEPEGGAYASGGGHAH
ncbi:urease accessory protein UreE [Magnetospira sp. QH-2]|uniref:urease accessory protein UreE n=1 Tax=Magnetospira sp. (strain QH-2) TaxID=1288970 RepID=UPI0003E81547|nr:urease accessory protein UreE [Magnetospira sp. QH-2]CCQ72722.1 Urease accessory protein UreE [Magnetospira sp. QH-2]